MRMNLHHPVGKTVGIVLGLGSVFCQPALAWDYDLRGYLGYAYVASDTNFECSNRACQGVLDDSLFYGLSASIQGEHLGAQVIVSQDLDENPDISLGQVTWRQQVMTLDMNLRVGKIIVPLGLYGGQRITPTTQPGLVFPQSYLLNSFYDLLTLSDEGIGLDIRGDSWGLKAAIYKPEEATTQRIIFSAGTPGPAEGLLGGLLGGVLGILGLDFVTGIGGTPPQATTVTERHSNQGSYLGIDYRYNESIADVGWIRQEINGLDIDAYNVGLQTNFGQFQPSVEVFNYSVEGVDSDIDGISLNLVYSGNRWQAFASALQIDIGSSDSEEFVLGGVYYWDSESRFSTRLTWHRLEGNFTGINSNTKSTEVYGLAVGMNWD